jgi:hypothetical protein
MFFKAVDVRWDMVEGSAYKIFGDGTDRKSRSKKERPRGHAVATDPHFIWCGIGELVVFCS